MIPASRGRTLRQIVVPALVLAICLATACFGARKPAPAPCPAPAPTPPPPECGPCPPPPEPEPDPEVARLEEKSRMLELHLLEKESLIRELEERLTAQTGTLDEAIQEVVRAKAKLRSLESRAEAASQMAEAEIALKALEEEIGGGEEVAAVLEPIRRLLESSSEEFEKENFGGALYLSHQAKSRIQEAEMRARARGRVAIGEGEEPFAAPLALKVTKPTNVRERPSLGAAVLTTLPPGSPVTGHSHMGEWVRVTGEDGVRGWIHRSLLTRR